MDAITAKKHAKEPMTMKTVDIKTAAIVLAMAVPMVSSCATTGSGAGDAKHEMAGHGEMQEGAAMEEKAAEGTYSCPMHKHHTADELGKCPECGMALEKTG